MKLSKSFTKSFEAIATLTGAVVGAGILGIPYVIAQSGFLTGLIDLVVIGVFMIFINLVYTEVTLRTKKTHQISGYAQKYLGKKGFFIALFSLLFSGYTAMLAYMVGVGEILVSFFGGSVFIWGILYAIVVFFLIHLGLETIEESETFFAFLIVILLAVFFIVLFGRIESVNLSEFSLSKIFMPYGVILFAYLGIAAIPEMREELAGNEKSMFKCVLIGTLIPIIIYVLFAFLLVGVYGINVAAVSTISLVDLGKLFMILGNVFGILLMTTSFLAYGLALKELYTFDLNWPESFSTLVTAIVPVIGFLIFHKSASFTDILSVTGIVSGTTMMVIVLFLAVNAKKNGDRKPEFIIPLNRPVAMILCAVMILGAFSLLI